MDEFPGNSDRSKHQPPEEKKVERMVSGEPIRRKQPLGTKFRKTFIGGDARAASQYVIFDVLIPAARDALADGLSQGFERLIFGETRGGKRRPSPTGGASGYVSYNRYAMGQQNRALQPESARRQMSQKARAQHDFEEIILPDRVEANNVIDRLFDLINQYESASVADLYELVGLPSTPVDRQWGWTDMRGSGAARVRNGFLLDLPDPEPLR